MLFVSELCEIEYHMDRRLNMAIYIKIKEKVLHK